MAVFSSGSQLSAGAGQMRHVWWPARSAGMNTGSGATVNVSGRQAGADFSGFAGSTGGTATLTAQLLNKGGGRTGLPVMRVLTTALTDSMGLLLGGPISILEQTTSPEFPGDIFNGVWRYVANIAYPTVGAAYAAAVEYGLEILPGNVGTMFSGGGTGPGILFGPISDNQIAVRARRGFKVGLDINDVKTWAQVGVTDPTDLNQYEMRIVGATGQQPGRISFFINRALVFGPYSFSVNDALLPGYDSSGGGFNGLFARFMMCNVKAGAFCYVHSMHEILAPDETNIF